MRRFAAVLSLFVFSVSFIILVLPLAAACPVQSPVPLRGLYLRSDIVVVGRIGKPEKWKLNTAEPNMGDRYRMYSRSIPVKVEEIIKGSETKNLSVTEDRWQYLGEKPESEQPAQPVLPNAVKEAEPEFTSDLTDNKDRRLFFLSKDENGNYGEVFRNHPLDLTQKELDVYISRLRELANIYSAAEPSKELIVEWLVNMAEDPVTRFEGAFELRRALESAGRGDEDEDEEQSDAGEEESKTGPAEEGPAVENAAAESASGEQPEPPAANGEALETVELPKPAKASLSPLIYRDYDGDKEFAKLLTAEQKERLVRAFLNVRFNYEPVKDEDAGEDEEGYLKILSDADDELLGAVSALKDRRVIDRLLAELPSMVRHQAWQASAMMDTIAEYFEDDKLEELTEKYSDVSWGGEDDVITDPERAYDKPETNEEVETRAAEVKPVIANSSTPEDNVGASQPKPQLPLKTYGQRRAELFVRIMARCGELVLTAKK